MKLSKTMSLTQVNFAKRAAKDSLHTMSLWSFATTLLALNAVLLPAWHPHNWMLSGVRHSMSHQTWLHLNLALGDNVSVNQSLEDGDAEIQWVLLACGLGGWLICPLVDYEGIDEAGLHKEPQQVPPPLPAWPSNRVVGTVSVEVVHPTHVLVVCENRLWDGFLLLPACKQ